MEEKYRVGFGGLTSRCGYDWGQRTGGLGLLDEAEKLLARLGVAAEHAEHFAGHRTALVLGNAAHGHAAVT